MRFVLLNQTFYPDVMSTGQHLSELAVELVTRGHQVTVITGRRAYDEPTVTFSKREYWRGVNIIRVAGLDSARTRNSPVPVILRAF